MQPVSNARVALVVDVSIRVNCNQHVGAGRPVALGGLHLLITTATMSEKTPLVQSSSSSLPLPAFNALSGTFSGATLSCQ